MSLSSEKEANKRKSAEREEEATEPVSKEQIASSQLAYLQTESEEKKAEHSVMELLPPPIAELVISFVASGSKEDRLHTMLVQKRWLWLARKAFYPIITLWYASMDGHLEVVRELLKDSRVDHSKVKY